MTHTEFFCLKEKSHKFENFGWFAHVLATCDPIRAEIVLQRHYIIVVPIYKLVISDKVLVFFATPR